MLNKRFILNKNELLFSGIFSIIFIGIFGSVTGLLENSFFIRMTDISTWDYIILVLESVLLALFFSIKKKSCDIKKASVGGVFGFLGFACPVCNALLVYLFGTSLLLSYFEPIRIYVGFFGIILLGIAVYQKLKDRFVV